MGRHKTRIYVFRKWRDRWCLLIRSRRHFHVVTIVQLARLLGCAAHSCLAHKPHSYRCQIDWHYYLCWYQVHQVSCESQSRLHHRDWFCEVIEARNGMPPRIPRPSGSSRSLARYYFRKLGVTTFENCVTQLFSRCFSVVVMHQRSAVTSGASAAPVRLCYRCVYCSVASDEQTHRESRRSGAADAPEEQTHRKSPPTSGASPLTKNTQETAGSRIFRK